MPVKKTAAAPSTAVVRQNVLRGVLSAIPLGIALVHAAVGGGPAATPPGSSTTVTQVTQSAATGSAEAGNSLANVHCGGGADGSAACPAPYPMLTKGHPVDWWFVFKLNAAKFPKCGAPSPGGGGTDARSCPFGGEVQTGYKDFGLRFVYASAETPTLTDGGQECLGTNTNDPLGATFEEVYQGGFHYVLWNDQFYDTPNVPACGAGQCDAPWGHSKGLLAWNDAGEGLVLQVSTPDWPGAGSAKVPRAGDGNTLGCIAKDNDIDVSQHFFALRLNKNDLLEVLAGLGNASVGTDPKIPQIVNNGGPPEVQAAVSLLGNKTKGISLVTGVLSSGVTMISKPSKLNVPPWQMVSAVLGGVPLRTATWWANPQIPSTTATTAISCWEASLGKPGAVDIATTGHWNGVEFGLSGGIGTNYNHAKIGVSSTAGDGYAIFGDMNQQGTLSADESKGCDSSQNGRGGLFFVVKNAQLSESVAGLIAGASAPVAKTDR